VVERLSQRYAVTLFFFNPNVTDEDEYRKRLEAQRSFVKRYNASSVSPDNIHLVVGSYEPMQFLDRVRGYEDDAEGGMRCCLCFRMRLERTAEYAALHGYPVFTTTLSVSPHKDYDAITKIGTELALRYGVSYLSENFKKQNGFLRSTELAQAYELYRQNYCGCSFSKR
jgi:predicted adenine nucleotide alpha hydrolase (AANH) superfamily ATPase